jgi:hypothetical protein
MAMMKFLSFILKIDVGNRDFQIVALRQAGYSNPILGFPQREKGFEYLHRGSINDCDHHFA